MTSADAPTSDDLPLDESDEVFASAAELFRLLATPIRLKIISALCGQEKNVSQLLMEIETTQPNMSQHLAALHRAGVLSRRRDATQIYYRIGSERAATLSAEQLAQHESHRHLRNRRREAQLGRQALDERRKERFQARAGA